MKGLAAATAVTREGGVTGLEAADAVGGAGNSGERTASKMSHDDCAESRRAAPNHSRRQSISTRT
ncbi:hypothetical protein D8S82_02145 [Mycobacterium hodleri]|uniref:Uncharacterized protein n=1 Tax=Mycolicibacterium hodleri TaxID=49897 RepID=A0A544W7V4_9MYCO|nr:hypothetical protein [Mycolicibacterium hodleri]TQR88332.1 hypothetical protein D8S82_02145 [Mycolicibacterium hodleri]